MLYDSRGVRLVLGLDVHLRMLDVTNSNLIRNFFTCQSSSNNFPWSLGSGTKCLRAMSLKIHWQFEIVNRVDQMTIALG